ncbi:MAG: alpha/beta hydrolase [Syntrophales bacterium]|nr:alpha/beta hydrolase [Syntrophales bacterium]
MRPTKKKSIWKKLLVGCGTLLVTLLAIVVGLAIWLSPGKDKMDSLYHPFKSERAQKQYLALYDAKAKKWPVSSQTKMVDTSFGTTFVRISGPENAPALVLLHGAGGNSLQWLPNIAALSQRCTVYAVDNIYDYGRSVYRAPITGAADYVVWLHELLEALGLGGHLNMVGLSYGGWITCRYALQFPDTLNKIVLLAPAGTVLPLSSAWIIHAVPCALPFRFFTKNFLHWLLADLARQGEAGRALLEEHIDESFLAIRSFKTKSLVNPTVLTDAELQSLKVPALFIVGENEKIYSPRAAIARLHQVAPRIHTKLIPAAGHDLTMVQAEMVNKAVLEFLSQ